MTIHDNTISYRLIQFNTISYDFPSFHNFHMFRQHTKAQTSTWRGTDSERAAIATAISSHFIKDRVTTDGSVLFCSCGLR